MKVQTLKADENGTITGLKPGEALILLHVGNGLSKPEIDNQPPANIGPHKTRHVVSVALIEAVNVDAEPAPAPANQPVPVPAAPVAPPPPAGVVPAAAAPVSPVPEPEAAPAETEERPAEEAAPGESKEEPAPAAEAKSGPADK